MAITDAFNTAILSGVFYEDSGQVLVHPDEGSVFDEISIANAYF